MAFATSPDLLQVSASTLVELLQHRAQHHPTGGYTFLEDGEQQERSMPFAQLEQHAKALAAQLQWLQLGGTRALLLFPPGLEYIRAFFGCLYAGVVAVPAYPPDPTRLERTLPRLRAIAADAQTRIVLTTQAILDLAEAFRPLAPELGEMLWLAVDRLELSLLEHWVSPAVGGEKLAFIQYTSGSTGQPKGVLVSHTNLLSNLRMMCQGIALPAGTCLVSWLPLYHDLGLVGGILQALYRAGHLVFMSPLAFLQRPARWLSALSRYRAEITGGPNFAYDLAARKVTLEESAGLDLSQLKVALNGAEPIHAATLRRFFERFKSNGLRWEALYCTYGLAECTLMVSCPRMLTPVRPLNVVPEGLRTSNIVVPAAADAPEHLLIPVGQTWGDMEVRVVDPVSCQRLPDLRVGEIWVRGSSVALGYFNRPEETEKTFRARLSDGEGPYLRTGDLGFLHQGALYVSGRQKDLIIIRGQNYAPHDIEHAVERCHPKVRAGCCAAFGVDGPEHEQLVIVVEVDTRSTPLDTEAILSAIRTAIAASFELRVHAIRLLPPGSLPKTSSGKRQRAASKQGFLDETLESLASWTASYSPTPERVPEPMHEDTDLPALLLWLTRAVADELGMAAAEVRPDSTFTELGLDSRALVGLSGALERQLGTPVPPTLFYRHPTPIELTRRLLEGNRSPQPAPQLKQQEAIAVISMACRFPGGASSPEAFWRLLEQGTDAITEIPPERFDLERWYDPDPDQRGKSYSRWGGFVGDVSCFDAALFGMSPGEARSVDPQERLLLEVAWETLERAGIPAEQLMGSRTGVYVGLSGHEYQVMAEADIEGIDAYSALGSIHSLMVGRLSYLLGLTGPNLPVDTACSSSLLAVHLACQALRDGECTLAFAGGVNLLLAPTAFVYLSRLRALSPTGRCRTFSADADGYVRADACGLVLLKRLSDAQREGDEILAVIRTSAVTQDGRSNGPAAPNGLAQVEVIRQALQRGGIPPAAVSYVECHGTGTPLGDPIEVQALGEAYQEGRSSEQPLLVGSVKSNIGHAEAAGGIAGLIKTLLSLQHRTLPASLHLTALNPHIAWDALGVQVVQNTRAWPASTSPLRAGVSAFGLSGTNVHVVVEEAPAMPGKPASRVSPHLGSPLPFLVSGRGMDALHAQASNLVQHLLQNPGLSLLDLAFSLATTRTHLEHRAVVVASERDTLLAALKDLSRSIPSPHGVEGIANPPGALAFLFPGQGTQWEGMARALLEHSAVFRAKFDACAHALAPYIDWSLHAAVRGDPEAASLDRVDVIQPVLFAMMVSLAAVWRSLGITPRAVIGHSQGEVAAAHVAGVLTLEDAARVVALRSRALVRLEGTGAMAAVELDAAQLAPYLTPFGEQLALAALNGPQSSLVSGAPEAIETLLKHLENAQIFARRVRVSYASHCAHVETIRETLLEALTGIQPQPAALPMISTVTLERIQGPELTAEYWYRNLREPVRFGEALSRLLEADHRCFVEVSPHPVLMHVVSAALEAHGKRGIVIPTLRREQGGPDQVLRSLGMLHCAGHPLAWRDILAAGQRIPLPTYAFQRVRHWLDPVKSGARTSAYLPSEGHPLLGRSFRMSVGSDTVFWEATLSLDILPWLDHHRVETAVLLPAAAYVEMCAAALREALGDTRVELQALELSQALVLSPDEAVLVQVALETAGPEAWKLSISQWLDAPREAGRWRILAMARAQRIPDLALAASRGLSQAWQDVVPGPARADLYAAFLKRGLSYGRAFQGIERVWINPAEGRAVGRIRLPGTAGATTPYRFHPALLDACLQVAGVAAAQSQKDSQGPLVPVGLDRVRLRAHDGGAVWCEARVQDRSENPPRLDLQLWDEAEEPLAILEGLRLAPLAQPLSPAPSDPLQEALLAVRWHACPSPALSRPGDAAPHWVVIPDSQGFAARVEARLKALGAVVTSLHLAPAVCTHPSATDAAPSRVEPLAAALNDARQRVGHLEGVLFLAGLDLPELGRPPTAPFPDSGQEPWLQLLPLIQAMSALEQRDLPRLVLVTVCAQGAPESPRIRPEQGMLWGLGATVSAEHSALHPMRLDVSALDRSEEVATLVAWALSSTDEDQVALRGERSYVARLERFREDSSRTSHRLEDTRGVSTTRHVRPDGAYLISGGLGALGLSVAESFASQGAGCLVLLGRSGITQPAQQQKLLELEKTGVHVQLCTGDVADPEFLEGILHSLPEGYTLRGVVHAAGVLDDHLLSALTPAHFQTVLRPKATGAWNLHRLTLNQPLDFFVLYSSAASVLASPGQGNYAAANAFLDALARYRRATGLPALSLSWGVFGDVGLAAVSAQRGARLTARGFKSLTAPEGVILLNRLLSSSLEHVVPCPLDLRQWFEFYPALVGWPFLEPLVAELEHTQAPSGDHAWREAVARARPEEARALVLSLVREQLGKLLRTDPARLDPHTPLKGLGIDSLMGMEIRNQLERATGIRLPVTALWTFPTLGALAEHLVQRLEPEPSPPPPKTLEAHPPSSESHFSHPSRFETLSEEELLRAAQEMLP